MFIGFFEGRRGAQKRQGNQPLEIEFTQKPELEIIGFAIYYFFFAFSSEDEVHKLTPIYTLRHIKMERRRKIEVYLFTIFVSGFFFL